MMEKKKTYILKYAIYNGSPRIFLAGLIVEVIDPKWEFRVVKGKMKGMRGNIAGGLNGYLVDNTVQNRNLFKRLSIKANKLHAELDKLDKKWSSVKSVKLAIPKDTY